MTMQVFLLLIAATFAGAALVTQNDDSDILQSSISHRMERETSETQVKPLLQLTRRKKTAKEGSEEEEFMCEDISNHGARVRWSREDGKDLPLGSTDIHGELTIPDVRVEYSGNYVCEAFELPANTPGRNITAMLIVTKKEEVPTPSPAPRPCESDEATCSNGECISKSKFCDGRYDCTDRSGEMKCIGEPLKLYVHPREKTVLLKGSTKGARFTCRDYGQRGAQVRWSREDGKDLPPGSTDNKGVLTIPDVRAEYGGNYVCEAFELPANTPGRQKIVTLNVIEKECASNEFKCSSGHCISQELVCNQSPDCYDESDEDNCRDNNKNSAENCNINSILFYSTTTTVFYYYYCIRLLYI